MAKHSPKIWLEHFRNVHGYKYDYSNSHLVHHQTKVEILCLTCEKSFMQTPSSHRAGNGCPFCGKKSTDLKNSLTHEEFVQKAIQKHGDRFDYSNSLYVSRKKNIIITCKKCNYTTNKPAYMHLRNRGCSNCLQCKRMTHEEFCKRISDKHGAGRFSYVTEYISKANNVTYNCLKCSKTITQLAEYHLECGCLYCNGSKHDIYFVDRLIDRYGTDKFDFSFVKIESKDLSDHIQIVCKRCDSNFLRRASSVRHHLSCRRCDQKHQGNKSESCKNWLDSMNISIKFREARIPNTTYFADAFVDGIIYEFYGSYWHGDSRKYDKDRINTHNKKTMLQLYDATLAREAKLKSLGYQIKFVWEYDWLNGSTFSTAHPPRWT